MKLRKFVAIMDIRGFGKFFMNGAYGLNGSLSIIWAYFELYLEDLTPGSEKI